MLLFNTFPNKIMIKIENQSNQTSLHWIELYHIEILNQKN